ncbi:zinc ribbon domain-containing protein [uncultured Methanobrevibacter sp.]|uniref:zinc ribbon domain-containing protein n=1 Tax=uncultured Methanobrevibacter sp. TaxID=253161 RepID=UPI002609603B|nr:zinc ribbon domain-containing protein [uncultured Methanobrevibacter sp.]
MTKNCPVCGKELPDDAHFCVDCGHDFFKKDSSSPISKIGGNSDSIFSNGKIFLVLIAAVVIVGAAIILSFGMGDNNGTADVDDGIEHVSLTIKDVSGHDSSSDGKHYYNIWTNVLFTSVPSNQKGYLIKTIYYDDNDTQIGQETESLSNVYYDTDYDIMVGYYTTYKKPDLDHVKVEIIYNDKTIDTFTHDVDKNKISFLT